MQTLIKKYFILFLITYIYIMPRKNPKEPLRVAIVSALQPLGIPVYAKKVPKSNDIARKYILINGQTNNPTERSKGCWEWLTTVNIECYYVAQAGYAKPSVNDQAEQSVIVAMEAIQVADWFVKERNFIQSIDLDVETDTQSIERRVITYEFWMQQIED